VKAKVSVYVGSNIARTHKDFVLTPVRGSGPGGQHRNKNFTGMRIKDKQTGLVSEATEHKSQEQNKRAAFLRLSQKLILHYQREEAKLAVPEAEAQVGRYIRTYDQHKNVVIDHVTNKKSDYQTIVEKGEIERMW
jgi:protein subunit release factor B